MVGVVQAKEHAAPESEIAVEVVIAEVEAVVAVRVLLSGMAEVNSRNTSTHRDIICSAQQHQPQQ